MSIQYKVQPYYTGVQGEILVTWNKNGLFVNIKLTTF